VDTWLEDLHSQCPKDCEPCEFDDGSGELTDWILDLVPGKGIDPIRCDIAKKNCFNSCYNQPSECHGYCEGCCVKKWLLCISKTGDSRKDPKKRLDDLEFETDVNSADSDYEYGTGNYGGERP
jgi:hypothetical protein